ncbi:MAG: hypothetical protein HYY84_03980 [Deltaproteobacteria bacterium]|nr:hypothetical protein [Deltaproteobacteria bacterium]
MSRKTFSIVVGLIGFFLALGSLAAINLMGSFLADARTENIEGPGVDVFLRTPYPAPGGEVVIDVEARGGSAAGVKTVLVRDLVDLHIEARGKGKTWGGQISTRGPRGHETVPVRFQVPARLRAGDKLDLRIYVSYVVAMSGGGGFTNETLSATLRLAVPILSESGRLIARALAIARALLIFALWFALVWGIAIVYARADDRDGPRQGHDAELEAISFVMGLVGGTIAGYWLFARTLMAAIESQSTAWAVVFTALWVVGPLVCVWRWWKRRAKLHRYQCALPASTNDGPRDVEPSEIAAWLGGCVKGQSILAKSGKTRVRWSGRRIAVDGLVIESADFRDALELAHHIAARVGRLSVVTPTGHRIDVDPARTIDEIAREYTDALVAEAQRLLSSPLMAWRPPR